MLVERDGTVAEVVRLNVLDDRKREEIIGFHFSQQYAKLHYGDSDEQPQFYVVGRDRPWDFEYVLHDGTHFFVEICRVADKELLKAIKAENDVMALLTKNELRGYEVLKVERLFPGTLPNEIVRLFPGTLPNEIVRLVQTKADKQKIFEIGQQDNSPKLFLRPPMMPTVNVVSKIQTAISKKVAKSHKGKENTILVLDNLTTHADPTNFLRRWMPCMIISMKCHFHRFGCILATIATTKVTIVSTPWYQSNSANANSMPWNQVKLTHRLLEPGASF